MTDLRHSIVVSLSRASLQELVSAVAVVLVVAIVVTDSTLRRRHVPHNGRRLGVAVLLGSGGLVVSAMLGGLLAFSFQAWGRLAPAPLVDFWAAHPVAGWITAFVAFDAVGHLHHRIGHHTALGWAAHAPHHSDPVFDASLAFRQSWVPIHGLLVFPIVGLGGWSVETIVVCAAISNLVQALQHVGSIPSPPQWVRAVIITPDEHRLHHQVAEAVNLGPIFTVWDRLGGSYLTGHPVGLRHEVVERPVSVWAAQFDGWRVVLDRGWSAEGVDDEVDAGEECFHVGHLDGGEAGDSELVAAEFAIALGVDDAVRP